MSRMPVRSQSTSALPRLGPGKPKLLSRAFSGFDDSWPECRRRLNLLEATSGRSSPSNKSLTSMSRKSANKGMTTTPHLGPVTFVFDGLHTPTVKKMRKPLLDRSASESSIRLPYLTSGRASQPPCLSPSTGHRDLERTSYGYLKTDKEASKIRLFAQVPLLRRLRPDQMPILASASVSRKFDQRVTIVQEGQEAHELFILVSGTAEVWKGGQAVATLKAGDFFGENSLLHNEPTSATVVATTQLECLDICRETFRELGLHHHMKFANRRAVGAGSHQIKTKPPTPKTSEEKDFIMAAITENAHLDHMTNLTGSILRRMASIAWKEVIDAGTEVIKHGDVHADYFYIVQQGQFEILVPPKVQAMQNAPHNLNWALHHEEFDHVTTLGPQSSFGEQALLYDAPRNATVRARNDGVLWVIDRHNFKLILREEGKNKDHRACLDKVEILNALLPEEKDAMAEALVEMHFDEGQQLCIEEKVASAFYILYDGKVLVTEAGFEIDECVASPDTHVAKAFGEHCLIDEPSPYTVEVASTTAKVLMLDHESFDYLLGPLRDIMAGAHRGVRKTIAGQALKPHGTIFRKDLVKLGLLGCGGFGAVELCEHRPTGNVYALKAVSKGFIMDQNMTESILGEKLILMMCDSPFIINLHECYNGAQFCYFLLDAALGGELYATYQHHGLEGDAVLARYYSATVVLAFEYLHSNHIMYRDLKPENLLLTTEGHCKLTDMGLAKFVLGHSYTSCGTPDYFSPEMIRSTGHTHAVDWWTLGILIYELMVGFPPFEADSPMDIYDNVLEGIHTAWFPAVCEGPAQDLICKLATPEPELRLPMAPGGVDNIRNHPWFDGFDWPALTAQTMVPPFKPEVKDRKDMHNFTDDWDMQLPTQMPYVDDGSGWDHDFATVDEPDLAGSEPPEETHPTDELVDYDAYDDPEGLYMNFKI